MTTPLSPAQIVARCGTGICLGNFFDVQDHDTSPDTVSPILQAYSQKGFKSVRISVTWYPQWLNGACRLDDSTFMQHLDSAIYYSVYLGMCVVLNLHNEFWCYNGYDDSPAMNGKVWNLWNRIAKRYQGISQNNLIYETLNEPQAALGDWTRNNVNDPTALNLCRRVNRVAFDGIRNVEKTRVIMLTCNGLQSICQAGAVYPNIQSFPMGGADQYLMLSAHDYVPFDQFCGENGQNSYYLNRTNPYGDQYTDINNLLTGFATWKAGLNYPSLALAITEFGVGDRNNSGRRDTDIVRNFYRMTAQLCRQKGILPMAWNDCSQSSWFGMSTLPSETGGTVQWLYGLANNTLGYPTAAEEPKFKLANQKPEVEFIEVQPNEKKEDS